MQFFKNVATLIAAASLASAANTVNTVNFVSQDSITRDIIFTPNSGYASIPSIQVPGGQQLTVTIPQGWIGNFYSVSEGAHDTPGMLGEVAFNSWGGKTYYDVSAIVDATDHNGVKQLYPASQTGTASGCQVFPCNMAYYLPDDIQTQVTLETALTCTLGSATQRRDEAPKPLVFSRKFIFDRPAN